MLVLFETAAGHALFKVQDEAKLASADDVFKHFSTPEKAAKVLKLKGFNAFKDTTEAVAAATDMVDGKMGKTLKKFLKKNVVDAGLKDKLAVSDKALGSLIKDKLNISCVNDNAVNEVMRGIRANMDTLITGLEDDDLKAMTLGLSHSLSRYKLKFSADKVDTMIVQAIGLLDELDKEINTYSMRVREWFGWHFPEMGKIVTDNLQYAKCVLKMGVRSKVKNLDFSDILSEDVEASMREVCEVSMGTDISEEDVTNISALCEQVISLTEYRAQLFDYLKNRMNAIAPNLTVMVGELVGARLIAHAGSLMNLAKHPASTVQILGAEKALFRALKTKHDTPKYGLIYHASLIGQTAPKHKGKISRVLAAKTALAVRVDALGDATEATIGFDNRAKVEARVRQLENGFSGVPNSNGKTKNEAKKYVKTETSKSYNADADMTVSSKKRKAEDADEEEEPKIKKEKKDKKEKKHKKKKAVEEEEPKAKKEKKEKKEKKPEDDEKKEKKEKKDKKDKKEKKEKKDKKDKKKKHHKDKNSDKDTSGAEDDDDEVVWHTDLSAEAVAARAAEAEAIEAAAAAAMQASAAEEVVATLDNLQVDDENALDSAVSNLQRFLSESHSETEIYEELCRQQTYSALPVTDRLVIFFRSAFTQQVLASNQVAKYAPVLEKIIDGPHSQYQLLALAEHFCAVEHPELLSSYPILLKLLYDEDLLEEECLVAWANDGVRKEYAHWAVTDELAAKLKALLQPFIEWLENAEEESEDESDDE